MVLGSRYDGQLTANDEVTPTRFKQAAESPGPQRRVLSLSADVILNCLCACFSAFSALNGCDAEIDGMISDPISLNARLSALVRRTCVL